MYQTREVQQKQQISETTMMTTVEAERRASQNPDPAGTGAAGLISRTVVLETVPRLLWRVHWYLERMEIVNTLEKATFSLVFSWCFST